MATSYATPTDVATRLNVTFNTGETAQCEALLEDVSARMRARLPSLDTWITAGDTDAVLAKGIACELAMTAITVIDTGMGADQVMHPEHTVRISSAASAGIRLSDSDAELLTPVSSRSARGKAFSIHPSGDPDWSYPCPTSWY